jgi:hypothetical protein
MGISVLDECKKSLETLRQIELRAQLYCSRNYGDDTTTTVSSTKFSNDSTNSSCPHEEKNVIESLREALNILDGILKGSNNFDLLPREISIIPHSKVPTISYADIVKRSLKPKSEPPTYADKVRVGIDRQLSCHGRKGQE